MNNGHLGVQTPNFLPPANAKGVMGGIQNFAISIYPGLLHFGSDVILGFLLLGILLALIPKRAFKNPYIRWSGYMFVVGAIFCYEVIEYLPVVYYYSYHTATIGPVHPPAFLGNTKV